VSFGYPSSRLAAVAGARSESTSAEVIVKRSAAPDFLSMVNLIDNIEFHSVPVLVGGA
jgi:hypothetical protein